MFPDEEDRRQPPSRDDTWSKSPASRDDLESTAGSEGTGSGKYLSGGATKANNNIAVNNSILDAPSSSSWQKRGRFLVWPAGN
jgi:hypothetical protein